MDNFKPVIRFAVCSDLHINEKGDEKISRLKSFIDYSYSIADKDSAYKGIDAFLFAGDTANSGKKEQFEAFWDTVKSKVKKDTEVLAVLAKNHDNWEFGRESEKTGLGYYRTITGKPTDFHTIINGFHFIGISTCEEKGVYYNENQRRFLDEELKIAVTDNPDKPVFIMQHEHIKNTVYGSSDFDGWGNDYFTDILMKYPQTVHFSGHSHYPLNDPRSVFQCGLTAVGTGAMSYAELTAEGERKVHPQEYEEIAQGWIVEADRKNRLHLRGYDFISGDLLCSYLLSPIGAKGGFDLTPEKQRERCKAPGFTEDARLKVNNSSNGLTLIIPKAEEYENSPVFLYRIEGKNTSGEKTGEWLFLPPYWKKDGKSFYEYNIVTDKEIKTLTVQAENSYGNSSRRLEIKTGG